MDSAEVHRVVGTDVGPMRCLFGFRKPSFDNAYAAVTYGWSRIGGARSEIGGDGNGACGEHGRTPQGHLLATPAGMDRQ